MSDELKLSLQSTADGGVIAIDSFPFEIGRDSSCELWIGNDPEVSLLHARITRDVAGVCRVHDLESTHGTFVNDQQVPTGEPKVLAQNDEIRFGSTSFTVGFTSTPTERQTPPPVVPPTRAASPSASAPTPSSTASTPSATAPTPSSAASTPKAAAKVTPPASGGSGAAPPKGAAGTAAGSAGATSGGGKSKRNPILIAVGAIGLVLIGILIANSGGGSDGPRPTSEVVAEAKPSTVLVIADINGERVGNGSGWVYDAEEGLIVTNSHVVDAGEQFQISIDGDSGLRSATVVGVAPCDDLAVLKVDVTEGLRTMPLGSQDDIEQGDRLLTVGYPANGTTADEIQVTDGVVSVVKTSADEAALSDPDFAVYPNVIQTDAAINGGNSGGPALSEDGKLIGVNTLASTENQNQNFAIGVDRVKQVVPTLASGSSLAWAGFGFQAIPADQITEAGLPDLGGGALLVTSVVPGTGAADQKIFVDDLITTVNGEFVENRSQYCSALRGVKSGDVVPIEVLDSTTNYSKYYDLKVPFE